MIMDSIYINRFGKRKINKMFLYNSRLIAINDDENDNTLNDNK